MYNLSDIHGRKVLTGIDIDGNTWNQFELDYHGNAHREYCVECGLELEYGWQQTSNPQVTVCDNEIEYVNKRTYYFPWEVPLPVVPNIHPINNQTDSKYWLLYCQSLVWFAGYIFRGSSVTP